MLLLILLCFLWVKYGGGRKFIKKENKKALNDISLLKAQDLFQNDARAYHALNDKLTNSEHPLPVDPAMDHSWAFIKRSRRRKSKR